MEDKTNIEQLRLERNRIRNQYFIIILMAILLPISLIITIIKIVNGAPFKEYWSDFIPMIPLALFLLDFKKIRQKYNNSR